MQLFYESTNEYLEIFKKKASHNPPHMHKSIELIYVTEGSLELGIGQEFYHMDKGAAAIVFPDLIHHYQVFEPKGCRAIFMHASPKLGGKYLQILYNSYPLDPVISEKSVHPDVLYAFDSLLNKKEEGQDPVIAQGFVQIILARCFPFYQLIDKKLMDDGDIVYQVVVYMAGHYTEQVSLAEMSHALGYSPYVLSRVFSGVFHTNFNKYLNNLRLDYAENMLVYTNQTITDVWIHAGFDSQRTFNRVFKQRYHVSPREFRQGIYNKVEIPGQ